MRRLGTIVGAGVLLLLASACANPRDDDQQAGRDDAGAPATSHEPDRQPARTPPSGGERIAPARIDATALPKGYPVLVWTEDDGRTLGVVAEEGGCGRASVEVPSQSAGQVVVRMVETVPAKQRPCTMDLRYPKITTELDAPLRDRTVVLTSAHRKR